jgi:hypothetical protein
MTLAGVPTAADSGGRSSIESSPMRHFTLSALLICLPCLIFADGSSDALERLESGTERMTDNLLDFYVHRVPELAEFRPDMSWDDEFRDAGQCFLDGLKADGADAAVATYLDALEDFATAEITNFTDLTSKMPEELSTGTVLALSDSCGTIAIGTARMAESGMNEAFAKEGVMERVLAPAQ